MKHTYLVILFPLLMSLSCSSQHNESNSDQHSNKTAHMNTPSATSVYDFTMPSLEGDSINLSQYKGKVLLIVNTASKCGLTPQYKDIEAFYKTYKDKGVEVLGFPANNFLFQEPGDNAEIKNFCERNYGVSFPMFSKISVKGKNMHPLYQYLTEKEQNGVFDAPIQWNFQKFLIDKEGHVVKFFAPKTEVTEPEFLHEVDALIGS